MRGTEAMGLVGWLVVHPGFFFFLVFQVGGKGQSQQMGPGVRK